MKNAVSRRDFLKKAGLATKLVILILLIAVALALLSVREQLQTAQEQLDEVTRQVRAQTEINAGLAEDIANSGDAGRIEDIAREKLDLVEPDERVFVDANH